MDDVRREFISTLSVASVETRYPVLLDVALEKYSEAVAREFLEKAEDFVKWLEAQGIRVERIFLFGSHARGEAGEDSDVDVIVVSRDFSDMSARQRWEVLGRAVASIMEPVEPIACTPEEVEE